jgi:membrane-associated phospholipid phosphatase
MPSRRALLRTTGIILIVAAASPAARAEQPDLSTGWPEGWRRIGTAEGAAVGGLAGSALALLFLLKAPEQPRWDSAILFDDGVRNALRASSQSARDRASTISGGAYLLAAYPIVVDAGLLTWLGRGQGDAALQLALVDAEALAITSIVTTTMQRTTGRARPFLRECGKSPPGDSQCAGSANDRNTSFVSGHAALAFTAASTLCVQHSRLSLYGGADAVVCPAALTIAAAVSVFRIVADKHWATDVIAGAALGSTVGTVVSSVHLRGDGPPAGISLGSETRSLVYWRRF